MNELYEIHTHLYGCLDIDDILWLGKRKKPRWEIFENSYQRIFGHKPDIEILYKENVFTASVLNERQKEILRSFYVFDYSKPTGFLNFQICFNFIIALSHTDPDELKEIVFRIVQNQNEKYSEYRMMFSPFISISEFEEKVISLIEGFNYVKKIFSNKEAKLILSLNREYPLYERQYEVLKEIHKIDREKILVGIDFAGYEEEYPPNEKKDFIQKVKKDNLFCVLYHVGESFQKISPASSIRWIEEISKMEVHRIGHAVSLGITEEMIKNKIFKEKVNERIDHLNYLENLYNQGESWIPIDSVKSLKKNIQDNLELIKIQYSDLEYRIFFDFREYVLEQLRMRKSVIESCPTSNMKIAGFSPLPFFISNNLEVCIGADDPGVLDTSLEKEFEIALFLLKDQGIIDKIKENNKKYSCKTLQEYKNF